VSSASMAGLAEPDCNGGCCSRVTFMSIVQVSYHSCGAFASCGVYASCGVFATTEKRPRPRCDPSHGSREFARGDHEAVKWRLLTDESVPFISALARRPQTPPTSFSHHAS
jgi:hypothetical protein